VAVKKNGGKIEQMAVAMKEVVVDYAQAEKRQSEQTWD
jgi:hypothetical protein